jgi:hypothetical protein
MNRMQRRTFDVRPPTISSWPARKPARPIANKIAAGILFAVSFPLSAEAGNCYAEYSNPSGIKMYTMNVGEKNIDECRKFNWIPFRAALSFSCPECKLDRELFLDDLKGQLKLIAVGEPAGWPYEIKGGLRRWYGNLSRDEALKTCRDNAGHRMSGLIGSEHKCVE